MMKTTAFSASGLALGIALLVSGPAVAGAMVPDFSHLLIAAGGGGGGLCCSEQGGDGQAGTSGQAGLGLVLPGGFGGTGGSGSGVGIISTVVIGPVLGIPAAPRIFTSNGGDGAGSGSGNGGFGPPTFAGGAGAGEGGQSANGGFGGGGGGYSGGGGSYVDSSLVLVSVMTGQYGTPNGDGGAGFDGVVVIVNEATHKSTIFGYAGTIVDYVIPTTGVYNIVAAGA